MFLINNLLCLACSEDCHCPFDTPACDAITHTCVGEFVSYDLCLFSDNAKGLLKNSGLLNESHPRDFQTITLSFLIAF